MYFNEMHKAVREAVKEFVDKELNPHMDEWEETTVPLHDLFKKMGELGFLGLRYSEKYGGQGLDYWFETVFLEELGHIHGLGLPSAITVQTNVVTPAIDMFGTEYLKQTYLKPAIAGEMVAAMAVTEAEAGSDVSAIKTIAVKNRDSYIIHGSKTFITNANQADFILLLARTSDEPGYHSFGHFIVPTNLPGFSVSEKMDKMGIRCSDTAEIFFDAVKVPAENLVGEEREGFINQMKTFQHERFSLLPIMCVAAKDIIDMTVNYMRQRIVFGKPLITNQVLRHRLVEWLIKIETLRQFTYHIVQMKMEGLNVIREVSMGKVLLGRLIKEVSDGCLQMFGGAGFMNDQLISRYYRDARLFSIAGGAEEVMIDALAKMEGL